jgi:hypothetical protein
MTALIYITNALIEAGFREMRSDEFKESYFVQLDNAHDGSSIGCRLLLEAYDYPHRDAINKEHGIQEHFEV